MPTMDFFETSDTSDKEVVLEDINLETSKSSEEDDLEGRGGSRSGQEEEGGQVAEGNFKEGSATTAGPSSNRSSNGTPDDKSVASGQAEKKNSGADSMDANAAERIKSAAFGRVRKQVERFAVGETMTKREDIMIPVGAGSKLQDIPYVAEQINKHRAADLLKVHRFIFGRTGVHAEVKKHMRMFSGFGFVKGSVEYEKKKQTLNKMEKVGRDVLCDCFGLNKSGTKEAVVERVMDFLMTPSSESVTKKINETGKEKRTSPSTPKAKKGSPAKPKSSTEIGDGDASGEQSAEDKEEVEKPKKKSTAAKKSKKSAKELMNKASNVKQPNQSKKRKKKESDQSSEEEAPLPKKRAKPAKKASTKEVTDTSIAKESAAKEKNGFKKVSKKATEPKQPKSSPAKGKAKTKPIVPSFGVKKKKGNAQTSPQKAKKGKKGVLNNETSQSDDEKKEESKEAAMDQGSDEEGKEELEESAMESDELNESTIKRLVTTILDDSDLTKISMKGVIEKLKDKLPALDIDENKEFIKSIISEKLCE